MERTLKLILAYDGTAFHGWQRQAEQRTVQQEVEEVLRRVLRHPLHIKGASRTDTGVHARGQVATVLTQAPVPTEKIIRAIGDRLPEDISLLHVAEVPPTFHPSLDALSKLYRYRIHNAARRPTGTLAQRHAWHVWYAQDLDRLRDAARRLTGRHDFAGFATAGSERQTTVRIIHRVEVRRRGPEILLDFEGDGFLYNQVRNMVGTLIEIGRGFWPSERIDEIIATGNRQLAAATAPPHGLCLEWIRYTQRRS